MTRLLPLIILLSVSVGCSSPGDAKLNVTIKEVSRYSSASGKWFTEYDVHFIDYNKDIKRTFNDRQKALNFVSNGGYERD